MNRLALVLSIASSTALAALPVAAQSRGPETVPAGHLPPPGMCRIWIEGVPPGQQPAPTDCATAVRNRPSNGRVIFGEAKHRKQGKGAGIDALRRGDGIDWSRIQAEGDRRGRVVQGGDDRIQTWVLPRGSDACEDRNRDGRCDDVRRDPRVCADADYDGVCDDVESGRRRAGTAGRESLPAMIWAVRAARGERPAALARWFGGRDVSARYTDADRNGFPERATWIDARGDVVQVWTDHTRDGRADRVDVYRGGRRVEVIGR